MIITLLFVLNSLVIVFLFLWSLGLLLVYFWKKLRSIPYSFTLKSLKRAFHSMLIAGLVCLILLTISSLSASSPVISSRKESNMNQSISELVRLELNGRKQWISVRGQDKQNPLLLFLAGGPGGSQLAAVRYELHELEKDFVVVGWDQPGSGKSFNATKIKEISPETYIQDGLALTEYLCKRFKQDKIYLLGESWGSALGVFMVERKPEVFYAFIGTGQMVAFVETEQLDYSKALEIATKRNDQKLIQKLESNGTPPYYGKGVTWKSAVYLNYLTQEMNSNPQIHRSGYQTFRDLFSPEYNLIDKINFFRGIITTFNHVYPQLYDIDLRKNYPKLDVPIFFFEGRHDLNAPPILVEEYLKVLEAPEKELLWFEHSGHSPWINEPERFVAELKSRFQMHLR